MIDFKFLTPFQLVTFVLGIVLSILTIGMVFYTLKRPNGYRNNVLKVIFTFILPTITIIMWFMCIFAAYEIFEQELYSILIAMAAGAVIASLTYLIAWLINKRYGKTSSEEESDMLAEIQEELDIEEATKTAKQLEAEAETNVKIEEAEETIEEDANEDVDEENVNDESNDKKADENKND